MQSISQTELLRESVAWLSLFVILAGLVLCLWHWRLSVWMWPVIVGLAGLVAVNLGHRGVMFWVRSGAGSVTQVGGLFLLFGLGSLGAWALFLGGLAGVFFDVRRRLNAYEAALRAREFDPDPLPRPSPPSNAIRERLDR
jgi:hypothetical protein